MARAFLPHALLAAALSLSATELSPKGASAAEEWVMGDASHRLPRGYVGDGTRRFATGTIKYRLAEPTSRQAGYAREAVRFWSYVLAHGVTFIEVTDPGAQILVTYSNSWTQPGIGLFQVACGASPFELEPDRVTYRLGFVLSNTKKGCDSRYIVLHEFGHLFTTFGHPQAGIMSKTCAGCPTWNQTLTPEQNAARAGWEGVPGLFEAARWVYTQPAGQRSRPTDRRP